MTAQERLDHLETEYQEHTALDIGRLSADAVKEQYERAAQAVEEMGKAVTERIARLEAALRNCDADMKILEDAAVAIREKGNLVYAEIEHTNAVSNEIRDICRTISAKLGVTTPSPSNGGAQ